MAERPRNVSHASNELDILTNDEKNLLNIKYTHYSRESSGSRV